MFSCAPSSSQKLVCNRTTALRAAIERSLKRLSADYIDLYYIHRHEVVTPVEEAFGALMDFKREATLYFEFGV